jgi:diguanylate cyclase (GGDEF)-like protein/PAS domain S-box-containing protein
MQDREPRPISSHMSPSSATRRFVLESAITAVIAGVWMAVIVSGYGGPSTVQTVSNVGLAAVALMAGLACARAAWRESGRPRRAWLLLAAAAGSWGAGQVAWTWYESLLGREVPFPSAADVGYLAAVPLAAAGLLALPAAAQNLAGRVRTVTDGLMVAASLLLVSWIVVLGPLVHAGGDGLLAQAIGLAYPIGDVVIATIVLYVVVRARQTSSRMPLPLGLLGSGLVAIAVADSGFMYLTVTESYASGNLIDLGWFLGYTLVLLAARKPPASVAADPDEDGAGARPLGLLLPYVAVAIALAASSVELYRGGVTDPFVSWTRTCLIVLMVARQLLTLLENHSLTRHLEARVRARTAELQASEQRLGGLLRHSSEVVTIVDVHGRVLYLSESVQRIFGYAADSLVGQPLALLLEPTSAARVLDALAEIAGEPYAVRVLELPIRHHAGHRRQAEMTITNLLEDTSVHGLVLNIRDVSQQKELENQLVHQAFHDSLTALPNRALFTDRLQHTLHRRDRHGQSVAVLFLDLDGFKEVNDSLGHAAGDLLLGQVAQRLQSCVRPADMVARLGGDEFAVLLEDRAEDLDAAAVADRLTTALREPFRVADQEIHVRGSVGIALADADLEAADQLLRNADLAMYRAKAAGEGGFARFDPHMHTELVERRALEADLRGALDSGQLTLHYQPTLALSSGEIVGLEALLRWQHPSRGLVAPGEFIPLAEETGLIRPIGRWILQEACRQAVAWQQQRPEQAPLTMSVNISGRQLQHADLLDDVADALATSGLSPQHLVLEITESVLMEHTEDNITLLERLKKLGLRLAIDDFGTGYSSLSYLHRFPVDVLKIDRSFIERLDDTRHDSEFVRTIVRLAHSLQLETVAEGIEQHTQFLTLKRIGCDLGQGFHFARPLPAEEITQLLTEANPRGERTLAA